MAVFILIKTEPEIKTFIKKFLFAGIEVLPNESALVWLQKLN